MKLAFFKLGKANVLIKSSELVDLITSAKESGLSLEYDVLEMITGTSMSSEMKSDLLDKVYDAIAKRAKNTVTKRILGNYVRGFKKLHAMEQEALLEKLIEQKKIHPTKAKQTIFYNVYVEGQNEDYIYDSYGWIVSMGIGHTKFVPFHTIGSTEYQKIMQRAKKYGITLKCKNGTGGMYFMKLQ